MGGLTGEARKAGSEVRPLLGGGEGDEGQGAQHHVPPRSHHGIAVLGYPPHHHRAHLHHINATIQTIAKVLVFNL